VASGVLKGARQARRPGGREEGRDHGDSPFGSYRFGAVKVGATGAFCRVR